MGTRGRAVRFQRERGRARGGRAPRGLVVAGEASLDAGPAAVEHDDVLANRHPLPPRARRGSARGAECDWRERVGSTSARRVGGRERRFAQSGPPPRVARIPFGTGGRLLFPLHLPSRRRSRSRVGQNGRRYPDAPGHALSRPQGRSRRPFPSRLRHPIPHGVRAPNRSNSRRNIF